MISPKETLQVPGAVAPTDPMETAVQKRVTTEQLKPGMYIHDLGTDWMSHGFIRSRFTIKDEVQIAKIREAGIRELYIDVSRGLDVEDAPTRAEYERMIETGLQKVIFDAPPPPAKVGIREEMARAREIHARTHTAVKSMMNDVRMGASVTLDSFEPLVAEMTSSMLRNSGALLSLGQLKDVDDYTFQHCVSVSTLMIALCRQLGLDGGNGQGKSGQGKSGGKAGQGARRPLMSGSGGVKEFVMGAVIVAMAVGLIVSVTRPLWQGALSIAP